MGDHEWAMLVGGLLLLALYVPCSALVWRSWKVRRDHGRTSREG